MQHCAVLLTSLIPSTCWLLGNGTRYSTMVSRKAWTSLTLWIIQADFKNYLIWKKCQFACLNGFFSEC